MNKVQGSKPRDNETTPFVDKHSWVPYQSPRVVSAKHARDLERRLRSAERLLALAYDEGYNRLRPADSKALKDHLAAAKEADNGAA